MHDPFSLSPLPTRSERRALGRTLRLTLPRRAHARFETPGDRPDHVMTTLQAGASGCMSTLR